MRRPPSRSCRLAAVAAGRRPGWHRPRCRARDRPGRCGDGRRGLRAPAPPQAADSTWAAAQAAAAELRNRLTTGSDSAVAESPTTPTDSTIIDLSAYERAPPAAAAMPTRPNPTAPGLRAGELLSMTCGGLDAGRGVLSVIRKGGHCAWWVPAPPEAFVEISRLCRQP